MCKASFGKLYSKNILNIKSYKQDIYNRDEEYQIHSKPVPPYT